MPRSHRTIPELPLSKPLGPSAVLAATGARAFHRVGSVSRGRGGRWLSPVPLVTFVSISPIGGRACNPPRPSQTAPTAHVTTNQQQHPPPPPQTDPIPLLATTSKGGVGSLAASPPPCTPPRWVGPRSSGGYCGGDPQYIPQFSSRAPPARHSQSPGFL